MDGHHRDRKSSFVELVSKIACMPACMSVAISVNCEKNNWMPFSKMCTTQSMASTEHAVSWNAHF